MADDAVPSGDEDPVAAEEKVVLEAYRAKFSYLDKFFNLYAAKDDGNKLLFKCKLCPNKTIMASKDTRSNLARHIQRTHDTKLDEYKSLKPKQPDSQKRKSTDPQPQSSKQSKMDDFNSASGSTFCSQQMLDQAIRTLIVMKTKMATLTVKFTMILPVTMT